MKNKPNVKIKDNTEYKERSAFDVINNFVDRAAQFTAEKLEWFFEEKVDK